MCRNIKQLRRPEGSPTEDELRLAALQFVRKISGYRVPSQTNKLAFDRAVDDITVITQRMFEDLVVRPAPPAHTHEHGYEHGHEHGHEHSHLEGAAAPAESAT